MTRVEALYVPVSFCLRPAARKHCAINTGNRDSVYLEALVVAGKLFCCQSAVSERINQTIFVLTLKKGPVARKHPFGLFIPAVLIVITFFICNCTLSVLGLTRPVSASGAVAWVIKFFIDYTKLTGFREALGIV